MRIDKFNIETINTKQVYIHDDILDRLQFDKIGKKLHLEFSQSCLHGRKYTIDFINVIGFEITSCDFWGMSHHVLDFEYVECSNQRVLPKIRNKWAEVSQYNFVPSYQNYIETLITFSSGDQLFIACEYIFLEK